MIVYLAGNFPLMITKGAEREMCNKMPTWRRLYSFHYVLLLHKSEILKLKKEDI